MRRACPQLTSVSASGKASNQSYSYKNSPTARHVLKSVDHPCSPPAAATRTGCSSSLLPAGSSENSRKVLMSAFAS